MSKLKELSVSFESYIRQEHGHHTPEYMNNELESEGETCPVYDLLQSEEYTDIELFKTAIEEDDEILDCWATSDNIPVTELEAFRSLLSRY